MYPCIPASNRPCLPPVKRTHTDNRKHWAHTPSWHQPSACWGVKHTSVLGVQTGSGLSVGDQWITEAEVISSVLLRFVLSLGFFKFLIIETLWWKNNRRWSVIFLRLWSSGLIPGMSNEQPSVLAQPDPWLLLLSTTWPPGPHTSIPISPATPCCLISHAVSLDPSRVNWPHGQLCCTKTLMMIQSCYMWFQKGKL